VTEPGVVTVSRSIAYPPSDVWAALTDPAIHSTWFAPGDIQPVLGHRFTLDMGPFGDTPCEIVAVEAERLLAYSFGAAPFLTKITWQLEATDAGTLVSLEHSGFDLDSDMGKQAYAGMGAGWPAILERIEPAIAARY
jgi:uncharacterized protein YndB with AHSA1/START domain